MPCRGLLLPSPTVLEAWKDAPSKDAQRYFGLPPTWSTAPLAIHQGRLAKCQSASARHFRQPTVKLAELKLLRICPLRTLVAIGGISCLAVVAWVKGHFAQCEQLRALRQTSADRRGSSQIGPLASRFRAGGSSPPRRASSPTHCARVRHPQVSVIYRSPDMTIALAAALLLTGAWLASRSPAPARATVRMPR